MKATELMIGDWVKCLDSTHTTRVFAQVDAIEEGQRTILVMQDNSNWFLYVQWLEPIPITLDILEKNGLEKLYTDYYDLDVYEENDGLWRVVYHNLECSGFDESVLVSSVHELQHFLKHVGIEKDITL